jgi:hypothetical protein
MDVGNSETISDDPNWASKVPEKRVFGDDEIEVTENPTLREISVADCFGCFIIVCSDSSP